MKRLVLTPSVIERYEWRWPDWSSSAHIFRQDACTSLCDWCRQTSNANASPLTNDISTEFGCILCICELNRLTVS